MTTTIRLKVNFDVPYEYEVPMMSEKEFADIIDTKDTPTMVSVADRVYMNTHTCWGGYDGTCNCYSHPRKTWIELVPNGDGTHSMGPTVFGGTDDDYEDEED